MDGDRGGRRAAGPATGGSSAASAGLPKFESAPTDDDVEEPGRNSADQPRDSTVRGGLRKYTKGTHTQNTQ